MKNLYQKIAKHYDSIYHWKDYEKEVEILETFFKKYGIKVRHILDVGCGTGNHDLLLAKKGYRITGIDLNIEMLSIARNKVGNGIFHKYDMKNFLLSERFDAVICLFGSINYNLELRELEKTLRNFYCHLKPNGICIFDVWSLKKNFKKSIVAVEFMDQELDIIPFGYSKAYERRNTSIFLIREKGRSEFYTNSVGVFLSSEILTVMKRVGFNSSRHEIAVQEINDPKVVKGVQRDFFVGIKV